MYSLEDLYQKDYYLPSHVFVSADRYFGDVQVTGSSHLPFLAKNFLVPQHVAQVFSSVCISQNSIFL